MGYVDTYRRCKSAGEKIGFKVFFGVELKLVKEPNYPEFLLYGISEEDFIASSLYIIKVKKKSLNFVKRKTF